MRLSVAIMNHLSTTEVEYLGEDGIMRTCAVQDLTHLNQKDTYEQYSNIGHDNDSNNLLWVWRGNKFLTSPAGPNTYHHTVWNLDWQNDFRGRLTKDKKTGQTIATIFRPMNFNPETLEKVKRMVMLNFNPSSIQIFG